VNRSQNFRAPFFFAHHRIELTVAALYLSRYSLGESG